MKLSKLLILVCVTISVLLQCVLETTAQGEAAYELPVQLVGFPFIILSVRLSNFFKKFIYSVHPATYRARTRRGLTYGLEAAQSYDAAEVEKYIVAEFGEKACIYERVCAHYAGRAQSTPNRHMDWGEVFSQYKRSPQQTKEFFLLSVFMGDIVGSPQLCHQLGKRRQCQLPLSD